MDHLKKILSYPISIIFYFFYILTILIFWPIQWFAFNIGGYQAHKKAADLLSFSLMGCLYILGTRIKFINKQDLPENVPLIFVSNHQNIYDIVPIIYFLRKYHPKFVAKIELSKGFPSISMLLSPSIQGFQGKRCSIMWIRRTGMCSWRWKRLPLYT